MTWWEQLRRSSRRLLARADAEVRRRQRRLDATPEQRVDQLLGEIEREDRQFEKLERKLRADAPDDAAAETNRIDAGGEEPSPRQNDDRVDVKPLDRGDGFNHAVTVTGLDSRSLRGLADELRMHVFVIDADVDGDRVLVRAPTLQATEVAQLTTDALRN